MLTFSELSILLDEFIHSKKSVEFLRLYQKQSYSVFSAEQDGEMQYFRKSSLNALFSHFFLMEALCPFWSMASVFFHSHWITYSFSSLPLPSYLQQLKHLLLYSILNIK